MYIYIYHFPAVVKVKVIPVKRNYNVLKRSFAIHLRDSTKKKWYIRRFTNDLDGNYQGYRYNFTRSAISLNFTIQFQNSF